MNHQQLKRIGLIFAANHDNKLMAVRVVFFWERNMKAALHHRFCQDTSVTDNILRVLPPTREYLVCLLDIFTAKKIKTIQNTLTKTCQA